MQAAVDRPLSLLARPDLLALLPSSRTEGQRHVVSDPLTHNYFELSAEELFIFQLLSKPISLRQIAARFNKRFAPQRLSTEHASQFIAHLHSQGLLISNQSGQSQQLLIRDQERRQSEYAWAWTRLLAIRLPAFNPDRFLTKLHGFLKPMRGWPATLVGLVVSFYALMTIVSQHRSFTADLPSLAGLLTPSSLLGLAAVTILLKTLHELGHGIACKHFGGQVPRMGVMLLALAPCLYCDVSDLWRLPSRRQRLIVNAAGILVELMLAAIAVIVWRHTNPGLMHTLAINTVIVGTVGTLLINANPLMRYDGYYLLSDATDTPNLWQRSRDAMTNRLRWWFLQSSSSDQAKPHDPLWMALYGVASQLYLMLVIATVAWLIVATLKPHGLGVLGYLLAGMSIATLFASPLRKAWHTMQRPAPLQNLKPYRTTFAAIGLMALLAGFWHVPWTYSVSGQATTVLDVPQNVVATLGGRLVSTLPLGTVVQPGDVIAQLENPELERQQTKLESELDLQTLKISHLEMMRGQDQSASKSLSTSRAKLAQLQEHLAELEENQQRLKLIANRSGVLLSPFRGSHKSPQADQSQSVLPNWSGNLLAEENAGAWVEPGEMIARVGNPSEIATEMLLNEQDVERVRQGQAVRLAFDQAQGQTAARPVLAGEVVAIADRPMSPPEQQTSNAASLSLLQPPSLTQQRMYRVRISLNETNTTLLNGAAGHAKIDTGTETLGHVLLSGIRQTFRLN